MHGSGEDVKWPETYLRRMAVRSGLQEDAFSIATTVSFPASGVTDANGTHFSSVKAAALETLGALGPAQVGAVLAPQTFPFTLLTYTHATFCLPFKCVSKSALKHTHAAAWRHRNIQITVPKSGKKALHPFKCQS